MKLRKILALALAAATVCGLLTAAPVPASAAGFTDIADPAVAEAAELLRLLNVVEGDGAVSFYPSGNLTRAEFAKMAIEIRGEGDKAAAQMNRTIFLDVKGAHWARGYINYASSVVIGGDGAAAERLVSGRGDGNFYPDAPIQYAEAITMVMRLLGYTASDFASQSPWYDGYVTTAKAIGLLDGVSTAALEAPITRGQAAILFRNLLFASPKGSSGSYLTVSSLGGAITEEVILLSVEADDATGPIKVINTAGGEISNYKTDHVPFDAALEGRTVKLMLDKNGKVLAIHPTESGTRRTVTVAEAEATYITISTGERIPLSLGTTAYSGGRQTTYGDIYLDLKAGAQLTLSYTTAGKLSYVFLNQASASVSAMVAKSVPSGNPFAALVGSDTGYRILKNGVTARLSDIRQYDVATYDKATRTLSVSDMRITGVYESASPSPKTPLTVRVLGATLPVLTSAMDDLTSFKIGDTVTFLLTADGKVAGAVSPSAARSTAVGVVTSCTQTHATVTPLMDLTDANGKAIVFEGDVSYSSEYAAQRMQGALVTVSSNKVNQLTLSRLSGSATTGALDVNARTLGGTPLADNVYLYERVGSGAPVAIKWSQLTRATVPAAKISYVGKDYAGRVNILVLDDVTGDLYTYGFAKVEQVSTDSFNGEAIYNTTVSVDGGQPLVIGTSLRTGAAVGVTASLEKVGSYNRAADLVELKEIANVSRTAFAITDTSGGTGPIGTVTTPEMVLPIAADVVCYNAATGEAFESLNDARAYAETLTVYYDRAPEEGGKVRMVVAK